MTISKTYFEFDINRMGNFKDSKKSENSDYKN